MRKEIENENPLVEDHEELFDINLVGACVLNGQKIVAYNRDPKYFPRVGFVFRKSKTLQNLISEYLQGTLKVDPMEFAKTVRDIKARTKMPY